MTVAVAVALPTMEFEQDLPGFQFHPMEEELLSSYHYHHEPWDLPGMAMIGEREWYFFKYSPVWNFIEHLASSHSTPAVTCICSRREVGRALGHQRHNFSQAGIAGRGRGGLSWAHDSRVACVSLKLDRGD
ncbi:hypothetical protein ACQ4PT_060899 [Festuca glaucescens]